MKIIYIVLIVTLQGCLFFGSETEVSPDSTDTGKDLAIDDVGIRPSDTSKDVVVTIDLEQKKDSSSMDAGKDVPTDIMQPCDNSCDSTQQCVDDKCVCKDDHLKEGNLCVPYCAATCNANSEYCNHTSRKCECKTGFEGTRCIVGPIVKSVTHVKSPMAMLLRSFVSPSLQNIKQIVPFVSARSTTLSSCGSLVAPFIKGKAFEFKRGCPRTRHNTNVVADLVEFDPAHITVHHGTKNFNKDDSVTNTTLSSIAPDRAFLVFYATSNSTKREANVMGEIVPLRGGGLKIHFTSSSNEKFNVSWFLVESKDDAFGVEHVSKIFGEKKVKITHSSQKKKSGFLLWSSTGEIISPEMHQVGCKEKTQGMFECERGKNGKKIEVSLQIIRFQNPKIQKTNYTFNLVTASHTQRIKPHMQKDTLILGQLGNAGAGIVRSKPADEGETGNRTQCTVDFQMGRTNTAGLAKRSGTKPSATLIAETQLIHWY